MPNGERLKKHWVIFNPKGYLPAKTHKDIESAVTEAVRLAEKQPGDHFVVYESVRVASAERPKVNVDVFYGPSYDQGEIDNAIQKGTMAWADVPNATDFVREMRG